MEKKVEKLEGFESVAVAEAADVNGGNPLLRCGICDLISSRPDNPDPPAPIPGSGGGVDQYDPAYTGSGL